MTLIIEPKNPQLFGNALFMPSLFHLIAMRHAAITGLPLLQQDERIDNRLEIALLTEE
ncbi:hypothetical protein [Streptococcus moroccensis]|uniref:Uncharacterized protein n=1 Tax=Streptococcus moroccensis TaxID=1451356 RepID=A0ABT9YTN3_9STRE|nr:hypothetical protein [Streptococcus moroccensis]MDQ0223110.1 hypothetical protein [Streptococcus moroccensis]